MSASAIAAIVAAVFFAILVCFLAYVLLKAARALDEATLAIRKTHEGALPLLADAQTTLAGVNAQLDQVDGITKGVNTMTTNAAAFSSIVSSTLGSPIIKVAAFSYGVRRTVTQRREAEAIRSANLRHRASRRSGAGRSKKSQ